MSGPKPKPKQSQKARAQQAELEEARAAAAHEVKTNPSKMSTVWTIILVILVAAVLAKRFWPEPKSNIPPAPPEKEKAWTPLIDGTRAMGIVKRICDIGPRVSGTPAHQRVQAVIKDELGRAGVNDIVDQPFTNKTPHGDRAFNNIIAIVRGNTNDGVAIAAHYDSKEFPKFTFVGANDSASAVACLIEMARVLTVDTAKRVTDAEAARVAANAGLPQPVFSTYLCFVDGEESVNEDWGNQEDGTPDHTYGSRYLASHMSDFPIKAFINLDMVGDKDLSLVRDTNSSPEMMGIFESASRDFFGVDWFVESMAMTDDHGPFKDANIPVIDIIDFTYGGPGNPFWHKADDTPDKLDGKSLERVSSLVLTALPEVHKKVVAPAVRK